MGPVGQPSRTSGWPVELADSFAWQMVEAGIPAVEITGGGEPTLWRGFDKLVERCILKGREVGVVTNGSQLSTRRINLLSNCVWVRFSLDAPDEETHQAVHQTPTREFGKIVDGITELVDAAGTSLTVGISYCINPKNYGKLKEMCMLARCMGVNNLRFTFMYDKGGRAGLNEQQYNTILSELSHLQEEHSSDTFRILYDHDRLSSYSRPNDDFKKCYIQKFVWAIGADCMVYPCCINKYNPAYAFADIRKQTLKEIVHDMEFQRRQDKLDVSLCPPCWLRGRNQAIEQTQEKPMHANFL
jgi:MoaA/NifB/PqqE/SkfB family radical SAM enzyme